MNLISSPKFVLDGAKHNARGIGNCAVLAVTAATGLPYEQVERAMQNIGMYRQGKGTRMNDANMQALAKALGFTFTAFISEEWETFGARQGWGVCKERTFNQFIKANRTGNHVITNRGHAVAVCDGHLIDNGWLISPNDKRNFQGRRKFLKGFTITMTEKVETKQVEPITRNVSTSNPGTQLSIFG